MGEIQVSSMGIARPRTVPATANPLADRLSTGLSSKVVDVGILVGQLAKTRLVLGRSVKALVVATQFSYGICGVLNKSLLAGNFVKTYIIGVLLKQSLLA